MAIRVELNLRLQNSPGALASVCRALSDAHVNILAMSVDGSGQLRLVVDNHVHAAAVLSERHHRVTERSVVVTSLSNAPGTLGTILKLVSDAGLNVDYAYGGAADGGSSATVVLGFDDAGRVHIENEGWCVPTLQERRAILFAAREEVLTLEELITILEKPSQTA